MKLGGNGGGPPDKNDPNNYNRQMAELLRREKQAKKRQVRIYIQNVYCNCIFCTILFLYFRMRPGKGWKIWKMPGKLLVTKEKKTKPKNVNFGKKNFIISFWLGFEF